MNLRYPEKWFKGERGMDNSEKNDAGVLEVKKRSKAKAAAVIAVCCFLALCACAAAMYVPITVRLAERDTLAKDFESAYARVENISGDKAETLRSYIDLRRAINDNYPILLEEYDAALFDEWLETTTAIIESDCGLSGEILSAAYSIRGELSAISGTHSEYLTLRDSVLSLMDVFGEYNRLHTEIDGINVSFTVNGEIAKLDAWQTLYEALLSFSDRRPGESGVYLLNFLLRETESKLADLRAEMESITAGGYDGDTDIRYSDNIQQQYPDITNRNGDVVNLLDKQNYERYMYEGICENLVKQLAEFYIVKG